MITRDEPPGQDIGNQYTDFGFRNYASRDGLVEIRVMYQKPKPAHVGPRFEGYCYEIWMFKSPIPGVNVNQYPSVK